MVTDPVLFAGPQTSSRSPQYGHFHPVDASRESSHDHDMHAERMDDHEHNTVEQVARAWIDAVNSHDPAQIRSVLADDFVWELGESSTRGGDTSAEAWRLWFIGFPDFTFEVLRSLANGEFAILQVRMRGTHKGVFRFRGTHSLDQGLAPTGKAFDLPGCAIHQVQHGKIIRLWAYWDTATLLRQLGLLPGA